jgi:hypothetical protein
MTLLGCQKASESFNQALEEEKSYTRHSMEFYRKNPKVFQGDKRVLETWSRADYVALAVIKQHIPGAWAASSDKLSFLDPASQHDPEGLPFCVLQQTNQIVVLSTRSKKALTCSSGLLKGLDLSRIDSGYLDFEENNDYWIYVLKMPADQRPT